ncbi:hypothetical protein CMU30_17130 [Elizabethkingia anophelis]|nr:hypothetical protein [Elizabethkingia anophelis]MDV3683567.1 hypothetical protein [Elizabethkingia anophelis]MDV3702412.1 hypothetical protein [Elizabethkingia anophelis]MDV3761448.1 hypothetical protein [Elizabethkingia anophelis]MDV3803274.1 hypothetical protein [Elizabethkingia anophelis]
MKRTILRASLWGVLTLSLFSSCRTDSATTEQTIASKEKIAAFERFEKENNIIKPIAGNNQNTNSGKYVSYSYPFALIIYNFLQAHPDYAKQIEKEVGTIRLDAVSQTFGNIEKSVIFPVTNNEGKVVALWEGIINENRDYVSFYSLNQNAKEINIIITEFQSYYDQKERRLTNNAIASIKGLNPIALKPEAPKDPPVKNIEEVVITVPKCDCDIPKLPGAGGIDYGTYNPGGGMSGGSDAHGGGSTSQSVADINYDKLKDYPCAYEVATQLPNLGNDLANLLKDIFGNNSKINITFSAGELQSDRENIILEGNTNYTYNDATHIFNATTTLNKNVLQTATQEYILRIMYHEVIHAYLGYEFNTLGQTKFEEKYPTIESYTISNSRKFTFKNDYQHSRYAPFIDKMTDAIMSYSQKVGNTNFTRERAKALAMSGLFEDLNNNIGISQIINDESTSNSYSKGKKCN